MLLYPMPMVFVTAGMFASLAALIAYVFLDREIHYIAGSGLATRADELELDLAPTASEHRPPIPVAVLEDQDRLHPDVLLRLLPRPRWCCSSPLFLINVREVEEEAQRPAGGELLDRGWRASGGVRSAASETATARHLEDGAHAGGARGGVDSVAGLLRRR